VTMLEGYLLSILAGGGWMAQILLERNGKEQDAKVAKAVGYGAMFAIAIRLGQEIIGLVGMVRLW
jgi:hypothetical protein